MMGLTGTGGYNDADTQAVNQLPTQEAKSLYHKMIQDRLKNKGFFGYLRFLAQKIVIILPMVILTGVGMAVI